MGEYEEKKKHLIDFELDELEKYLREKKFPNGPGSDNFLTNMLSKEFMDELANIHSFPISGKVPKVSLISNKEEYTDSAYDFDQRIAKLEKEINKLNSKIRSLSEKFEKKISQVLEDSKRESSENMESVLKDIGFKPITDEVLNQYSNETINQCKEIIMKDIKETDGYTDASTISEKYGFPLELVAGCFDSLIKEKKIGEVNG